MTFNKFVTTCASFAVFFAVTTPGKLPEAVYRLIFISQMFFFLSARGTQILMNYRNQSTGSLSIITCFLNWAGNLARLFTLIVDIGFGDLQVLSTHLMFFTFNIIPFLQIVWYNFIVKKKKEDDGKKELVEKRKKGGDKKEKEDVSKEEKTEEGKDEVVTKRKKKVGDNVSTEKSEGSEVVKRRKKTRKRED